MNNQTATKLRFEGCSVWRIVLSFFLTMIIITCLISIVLGLLGILISFIPILNIIYWIFAIIFILVLEIWIFLSHFGLLFSKAILTEDGIYGNKSTFSRFDLTFDKITSIDYKDNRLVIEYIDNHNDNEKKKKKKKKKVTFFAITNKEDFTNDCIAQYQKYRALAASAEAAADAE